jgi:meiotically up-regulated gene 157 (Mug157) protein
MCCVCARPSRVCRGRACGNTLDNTPCTHTHAPARTHTQTHTHQPTKPNESQEYGYSIPDNMYLWGSLKRLRQLNAVLWGDAGIEAATQRLMQDIRAGIEKHGIVEVCACVCVSVCVCVCVRACACACACG